MNDGRTIIIETAFRLFLERGFEATSMNDLVKACGLSKGALYHHFADKDALQDATIAYFFTRFFPDQSEQGEAASAQQLLAEMGEALIALVAEVGRITPDMAAYYRFILSILPKIRPFVTAQLADAQGRLAAAIRHEQEQGIIPMALSPDTLAFQWLAAVEGTALLCAMTGDGDVAARIRATIREMTLFPR